MDKALNAPNGDETITKALSIPVRAFPAVLDTWWSKLLRLSGQSYLGTYIVVVLYSAREVPGITNNDFIVLGNVNG